MRSCLRNTFLIKGSSAEAEGATSQNVSSGFAKEHCLSQFSAGTGIGAVPNIM